MQRILGTMTFGLQVDEKASEALVAYFTSHLSPSLLEEYLCFHYSLRRLSLLGFHKEKVELDTAGQYEDGKSESIIGQLIQKSPDPKPFVVATKANPWDKNKLSATEVRRQFEASLKRLEMDRVQILYLHAPDHSTPIEETLQAVNELYKEGKFMELGLSNYPAWQVADIFHLCEKHDWIKPTVYQGMYNVLTRSIEAELFPAIRKFGLRFYVFNPLAGGLLTGKYSNHSELPKEGRFVLRKNYQGRYWKDSYFQALKVLDDALQKFNEGIDEKEKWSLLEISFSWLVHHSKLDEAAHDGIIFGVSKMEHLVDAMRFADKSARRLPKQLLEATKAAWTTCQADCPRYFQ